MRVSLLAVSLLALSVQLEAQGAARRDSVSRLDTVRVRETTVVREVLPVIRSATRTPTRLVDLPQSLSLMTRSQLDARAVQSMADVVQYLPAVTMGQGEGHRDQPTMRGIASTADLYVDGVRDDVQYYRDLYNVDRVEVLRGPNALAFGRGGGGGVLNRVLRQADFRAHRAMLYEGGSYDHARGTLDLGGAIGTRLATRMNAMRERSGSFRGITLERSGVNPTGALVIAGGMLRASAERFEDRRTVDRGVPSFNGRPAPVPSTIFYGDRNVNRARAVVDHGRLEFERGDQASVNVRSVVSWSAYDKMYQNIVPGVMSTDGRSLTLSAYRNSTDRHNLFSQTDVLWRLRSARIEHLVLVGGEIGRQTTSNFRETGYFGADRTVIVPASTDGSAPAVGFRQSPTDADNRSQADVASAYVQHQGQFGRRWQTTAGVRLERFAMSLQNHRNGQTLERTDVLVNPRAALVFKPRPSMSVYSSLGTSALPSAGDQFASLTATSSTLRPERFASQEAGAKWESARGLRVSAAYYVLTKSRSSAPDPVRPGVIVQTGRQESRGVELEAQGEIMPGWQLTGAVTAQRARIVSRTSAAVAGASVPLVPARSVALWNRVQVRAPIAVGFGVVHQTPMYAAVDNKVTLPAFTRLDGALYLSLGGRLAAQANIENLANVRYVPSANGNNNLQPGAPRLLRVSLNVR